MQGILITRTGGIFSYPDHRPLIFDSDLFQKDIIASLSQAVKPHLLRMTLDTGLIYFKDRIYIGLYIPRNTPLTGLFMVKHDEPSSLYRLCERGVIVKKDVEYKSLNYQVPFAQFFIACSSADGQAFSSVIPVDCVVTYMMTDKGNRASSVMPNVYEDCRICFGESVAHVNIINWRTSFFSETAFDSTCLVYPKDVLDRIWRWDGKSAEFRGTFPADNKLLRQDIPENTPREVLECFEQTLVLDSAVEKNKRRVA